MGSRPDWLPKGWTYAPSTGELCDYCDNRPVHFVIGHDWSVDRYFRWCDSPTCEERARAEITGENE